MESTVETPISGAELRGGPLRPVVQGLSSTGCAWQSKAAVPAGPKTLPTPESGECVQGGRRVLVIQEEAGMDWASMQPTAGGGSAEREDSGTGEISPEVCREPVTILKVKSCKSCDPRSSKIRRSRYERQVCAQRGVDVYRVRGSLAVALSREEASSC